ncbi:hypothetical protein AJ80_04227 [Polytolypa hystricis UAMH7299]|uniref:Uncharacterized protein n=1 Tax=Polytolypa hystricis (strain UAMH7299) TaxID=1447883 RepID=A0A2B7YEV6_POLH7|nr:hypothetical protein AJ80_04227 [Polytolypa hystricis UAMH7299]
MNRYHSVPALRGQSKATATTLCQKCLKRDNYECKATAQERPYRSRPSRTQQLANPKLVPKLTNDAPNDLPSKNGIADEQLARREEERGRKRSSSHEDDTYSNRGPSKKRVRSVSPAYSSSSVSTISTNRSLSKSPPPRRDVSRSPYRSRSRKRKLSESPSGRSYFSHSPDARRQSRSPSYSKESERNTRRRRKSRSPSARGRHYDSDRRGSWRNRSRSQSVDKSRVARQRRSFSSNSLDSDDRNRRRGSYSVEENRDQAEGWPRTRDRRGPPETSRPIRNPSPPPRRDRSLSPYSKRLALTQSLGMGR